MPGTTVEINSLWTSLVRSPLMLVIWGFQGVSVSFAPLFLYWSGKGWFFPQARSIIVSACFLIIVFEGLFFMGLANHVVRQVRQQTGGR
jgi:hypothetical protein